MRYYADLKPHFNMRVAYPKDTALSETEYIGLHNYFYIQEDMKWGKAVSNGDAAIKLERTDDFDCVVCDGQVIEIPNKKSNRIIISGSCCWSVGYQVEKFTVEYADGTNAAAVVYFGDWGWPSDIFTKYTMEMDTAHFKNIKILKEFPRRDGTGYIHYTAAKLDPAKKIKRIIFPDNINMFVFGITLEV